MSAPANLLLLLLLFAPMERNNKSQIQSIISISYQHVLLVIKQVHWKLPISIDYEKKCAHVVQKTKQQSSQVALKEKPYGVFQ